MITVYHSIDEIRLAVSKARKEHTVGFVPTMGALHEGHASLIRDAKEQAGFVVVSIFVNPTQFGPKEDFGKYPRTLDADRVLCEGAGADAIFAPTADTIYPDGFRTYVEVEELGNTLCGPKRPGHFRGVCTVVLKLFNIVQPDLAVFGAKDFQQAAILQKMVKDLNLDIRMVIAPTIREADGLAMSSRNRYLNPHERSLAPRLFQALQFVQQLARTERNVSKLEAALNDKLAAIPGTRIDYATIVDAENLQPIETLAQPAVAALAVFLGSTRLIDNVLLETRP